MCILINYMILLYHSTIKIKPSKYIDSSKKINHRDHKLKLGILLEYQNIKTSLQKAMFQISSKTFLLLKI